MAEALNQFINLFINFANKKLNKWSHGFLNLQARTNYGHSILDETIYYHHCLLPSSVIAGSLQVLIYVVNN